MDHATDTKIDLCAVTETWLRAEDTVDLASLAPRGYSFRSAPRADGRNGGGTGIFVRDSLNIAFSESQQQQSFESSKWNIVACGRSTKFVIVYRPPYSETHPVSTNVFMQEFSVFLENLVLCPEVLVIAGDFNLHMDDSTDADALKFADRLETFGLIQHVNFATHVSGHWLDLHITRSSNDVMVVSPRPSLFLSDHCFVECSLAIPSAVGTAREVTFRKCKDIYIAAFQKDIAKSELTLLMATIAF